MKSLHLLYCRNHTPGSFLIRLGQGLAQWSHCGVIVPGTDSILEARAFHGVVETPFDDFLDRYSAWEMVEVAVPDPEAGIAWGFSKLGCGYDYGAVARFISSKLPGATESPERFHCVELVENIIVNSGLKRFRIPLHKVNVSTSFAAS